MNICNNQPALFTAIRSLPKKMRFASCVQQYSFLMYTVSQKAFQLWFAITFTQQILIFFGRNVTDKVGNQKVL